MQNVASDLDLEIKTGTARKRSVINTQGIIQTISHDALLPLGSKESLRYRSRQLSRSMLKELGFRTRSQLAVYSVNHLRGARMQPIDSQEADVDQQ